MIHKLSFYQVTCIESGECCTDATVSIIATGNDTKKLARVIRDSFNGTLVGDHQGKNLKIKDIEIKDGNIWVRTSKTGDLIYTYQVNTIELDVEVSFPLNHYHEDGVELKVV